MRRFVALVSAQSGMVIGSVSNGTLTLTDQGVVAVYAK